MSEYKGIKGFQVQTRTEDPTPYAQALADNPYAGSWAAGGTRNEARGALGGSIMGTQTANVAAGGNLSGSVSANAETYNGSSWTEGNNLNQARRTLMAAGLEPAGRVFGGDTSVNSTGFVTTNESYNGTSFTEEADLNTGAGAGTGIGLTTAALAVGGSTGPGAPNYSNKVENWDGSSWTEVSEINTTRIRGGGAGVTTAALFSGGQAAPGASNSVESWNGSSWTETTEINTARGYIGSAGASYTAALIYGGSPNRAITESWDGSSWTEVADLATGQSDNFGIVNGTNLLALSSGGETSPNAVTEEWSFTGIDPSTTPAAEYADAIVGDFYYNSTTGQFKTVNDGAGTWASGGNLNSGRNSGNVTGSATSSMYAGGENPGAAAANTVENYNGTSWTEITEMGTARGRPALTNTNGNSDVLLISGGASPLGSTNAINNVEKWNGSSWTEIAEVNTARSGGQAFGITTASIFQGGYTPPGGIVANTEYWNGSSWTELNDMNTLRVNFANWGVYNSGGMAGGSSPTRTNHETWDGSTWTETTDINSGRSSLGGGGASSSSGIVFGGTEPPGSGSNKTEIWDGTSWTETTDMGQTAGEATGSSNSVPSALSKRENSPGVQTEEWVLTDFQIKSVTTS